MSRSRRIAWTSATVLAVLALGSIVSAPFVGAWTIGPNKAFAGAPTPNAGVLGVGEATTGQALGPVSSSDKVVADPSVVGTGSAVLTAPSVKRTATVAQAKRVAHPKAARIGRPTKLSLKGKWNRAKVSWYGPGFYGQTMAGGGRLKRNSMIVAHKRLPFGTKIQFALKGRTVVATVQDRGPYIHGRVFDLGPGTAKALHFSGVGTVKYRVLSRGTGRRRH